MLSTMYFFKVASGNTTMMTWICIYSIHFFSNSVLVYLLNSMRPLQSYLHFREELTAYILTFPLGHVYWEKQHRTPSSLELKDQKSFESKRIINEWSPGTGHSSSVMHNDCKTDIKRTGFLVFIISYLTPVATRPSLPIVTPFNPQSWNRHLHKKFCIT